MPMGSQTLGCIHRTPVKGPAVDLAMCTIILVSLTQCCCSTKGLSADCAGAASDLAMLAALEGLPSEPEPEGPTMMGRLARELMLSGQGAAGLQQFKVPV